MNRKERRAKNKIERAALKQVPQEEIDQFNVCKQFYTPIYYKIDELAPDDHPTDADCQACGACCVDWMYGARKYVRIEADELPAIERHRLPIVKVEAAGVKTQTLACGNDGQCVALKGEPRTFLNPNAQVSCSIYEDRPKACRSVEAGSPDCRVSRYLIKNKLRLGVGGVMTDDGLNISQLRKEGAKQ